MKPQSLRGQINFLVHGVVVAAVASLTFIAIFIYDRDWNENLRLQSKSASNALATAIGHALESHDTTLAKQIVEFEYSDSKISAISVFDNKQHLFIGKTRDGRIQRSLPPPQQTDSLIVQNLGDYCVVEQPIFSRNESIGHLWLVVANTVAAKEAKTIYAISISGALVLLIITLITSRVIIKKILKPIGAFEEAAQKISAGDMNSPIGVADLQADFIPLGTAFENMQKALKSAFAELSQSRDHLEELANARAVELRETLQQYADLVSVIPSGLIILDYLPPDRLMLSHANPTARRLLGDKPDDWFGKELGDLSPLAHKSGLHKELLSVMATGKTVEAEYPVFRQTDKTQLKVLYKLRAFRMSGSRLGIIFDNITKSKEAEIALRSSETRYRTLFESANDAIFIMRGQIFIDCNSRTLQMFGCTRQQIVDHPPVNFSPPNQPDGRNSMEKAFERVQAALAGEPQFFEWLHCRLDGTLFYAEVSLNRISTDNETIMIAIVRDITDRKRVEETLVEREEKYRLLTENLKDVVVRLSPVGVVEYVSPAIREFAQYEPDEEIGSPMEKYFVDPREFEAAVVELSRVVQQHLNTTFRFLFKPKRGESFPIEVTAHPVLVGEKVASVQCVLRDISERTKAEIELLRSEEKFRTLFNNAGDAIFILDFDGKFLDVNDEACRRLMYTRHDLTQLSINDIVAPEFATLAPERIKAACYNENVVFESVHCRRDGARIPVEINPTVIEFGGAPSIMVVARDITERKKTEDQKQKLQEMIERAERMESVGLLAGGVAHDLNNMLGPIVGYSDLVLLGLSEDSEQHKLVQSIGTAAQSAAVVIQDLLTLARRGRYDMSPTNLNEVIQTYLDSPSFMQLTRRKEQVAVITHLEDSIGNILGSAPHLSKVIMNLVVNAVESIPESGTVTITTGQAKLDRLPGGMDKIIPGDYVYLQVRDTGAGIAPDDRARIFEPYYSKKKMGKSGSGLGLAVVYGILKDHKGFYDLSSQVGSGSEFTLYFPLTHLIATQEIKVAMDYSGTEMILVVDDVSEQRQLASDLLTSFGYKVNAVSSGQAALVYLAGNPVDLVILDMIMEGDFDGLETYRRILGIRPGQKAVIVSGFSATERVTEMQKLGAGAYVKKPYTRDALGRAVRTELDRQTTNIMATSTTQPIHSS